MDQMSDSAQDTQTPNTPELLSDEIKYHYVSSPPSSISTNTHDISRARYHMKELETFAVRVEEAAARAFPNRGRSRYAEVLVVLIKWEESDIDAQPEFNALRSMFEICYGFTTDTWSIPSTHSHNKLMLQAVNYIEKHGTEDNLIIIYYGGHAVINNSRQTTWSCTQDISHASVRWSAIQSVFEESKSDVLYLLDCCSAPGAAPSDGPGVIETIAASDFETWAPGPGRHSFTNALLHVLDDWMHRPSFSAAMLHSEILSVLKHEKLKDSHHGDPHKQENKKTPIYILASEDPKSLSIEICRRTTPGNSWAGTLSPGIAEDIYSPENLHGLTPEGKLAVPHVLISISLEENQLVDVEAWHKWIKQFPALAQFALVEGVFASHSTIILLSLPVLIWDMLPENLAVSFVAFVESRNLLSQISEKLGVEVSKQQQPKEFRGRPDSDTLQIPPPLPLIQQIEQALHKQKQQTMKDWETHFQKEKVRLEGKVQDARDDAQKKELEFLQERNAYRELMERDMREVKKESQVIKEESRRAWEELGRYEHEERERTRLLREGQPITIGGIQVIPMGETDEKDDRGRMVGDVAAWVGGVKSETSQTPRGREGSRARGPPDLLHERQYQELEGTHVARPENSTKRPHETHPNHSVGPTSPIHHENGDIHFEVSITRPPPGLVKPKSNASHQKFKDEKSIASFKSIASGVLSPPDSVVASDEIDESTHEEYESALSGGDEDGFGRGDRGSVDFLQEFLDAGDDAPWNLPRQSMIDGDVAFPQDNREKENRLPEKALDPDQITLEPKSYRSQSKHEPIKSKEPEPTALLDWERRGMQQKLAEHALPRPNAETTLEPTSPEPTKVKDVDPFTLQVLEKGIPQEVVERVLPGQVTPPRKSLELASRTDVGPLTLQALKTYEKLQEEMDTHQATRRPERPDRPVEHIPNRLSHITERDGDWEPKTPGKVGSVGSPQSKRRDEKVGDKKALAAVEEAIKKLIIPEMEELKKEPEMTRKNSDGSGRVPWDSDEKSVGRTESVKHGKGKSSTKKAFEAVEDAIKKEAEALKKKEEEEEEMEALRKLRKGQKEKKRKDEEKEKPKRDGDDKDSAKVSSGRDMEPNAPIALEQKHDGKEVLVNGERALSAVDDAIRKLIAPELEGLKRTESHKSHKSHKSAKGQRHEKSKMNESTNQEPLPSRDESPVKEKLEKGHHRQHSVPKIDDAPSKEVKEANSKAQKASHIDQQKEGEVNSNAPLAKQKSDRGLWWMERKPPSHQREEQPREQLPSSSYSQKNKGKAQDVPLDPVPTPPLDLSSEAEDKHEMRILPQEIDHQTWKGFKFANRDVTPSMSSLPTAIPRSSLNNSTLPSSPNNPWSQSEGSFGTIFPPRTSLDYSRDPRMSFDFSRGESPHSQPSGSSTSNHNVYSQFPPLPEDRERPLSTPTIPTPLARAPSPPYQHSRFNGNHNPNNPYSQFAQFEQSLSTPTLQRVNTGSSYHSLDDTARSIHNVPMTTSAARSIHNVPITTSAARSIHNVPITNHPITSHPLTSHPIPSLAPVFGPSPYNQNQHQHAPISAVDPTSNPKHSFTFTTAPHSSHQSPPFYPAELPAFPHSLPLSRSNSNSNAQPPRHLQEWERGERGRLSTQIPQAAYLTQPLPSPSPSETETLLKKLILPELETLEKGERARREEEERSRREWEREFGIL